MLKLSENTMICPKILLSYLCYIKSLDIKEAIEFGLFDSLLFRLSTIWKYTKHTHINRL